MAIASTLPPYSGSTVHVNDHIYVLPGRPFGDVFYYGESAMAGEFQKVQRSSAFINT
ncbi:hypothetical protein M404DRAFT_999176 [Pisolithus tinctorius Marx 270]|uniref:Uncharacterized protein n=1 Tax=Pisolithus tinctorius Marx 270 TaxID=870435 RepID=A0A0C3JA95_PISTI|nr:hypothetical protein M404DRAFT_1001877 [Pisolithus tinctorius Marx 270]KIO05953.1 hypothetical protein M404DRAFT_999176 [Pisolithus tinctorius Marx 270]